MPKVSYIDMTFVMNEIKDSYKFMLNMDMTFMNEAHIRSSLIVRQLMTLLTPIYSSSQTVSPNMKKIYWSAEHDKPSL